MATVLQKDVPIYVEAIGQTRGSTEIEVRARVEGFIQTVDFKEGTSSARASCSTRSTRSQFEAAARPGQGRARRGGGAARPRASRTWSATSRSSPRTPSRARSTTRRSWCSAPRRPRVEAAQGARSQRAEIDLGYTKVLAPENGLAGKTEVYPGTLVGRGQSTLLTHISQIDDDPRPLHDPGAGLPLLRAPAPGGEPGTTGPAAALRAGPRRRLACIPRRAGSSSWTATWTPTTGTILLEAAFPNPGAIVRPGQYARVRAAVDLKKGAILVPQRAVSELQGIYNVAVVGADDTVEIRMVTPAQRIGNLWVIDAGLKAGDRVVVEGVQKVRPGVKVKPETVTIEESARLLPARPGRRGEGRAGVAAMADFFIRRPIVAIVISIIIVLLGLNSLRGLSFEQYPFLAPPTIRVTANYPGASAVAVEQSVATPIEQEVNGVEGMIYMKSSNTSDGRMQLDVNFQVGTDQDMANVLTQNRVSVGPGPPAPGSDPAGRHGQEAEPQHPDADLALLAERAATTPTS